MAANILYEEKGPGDSGAAGTLFNLMEEGRKRDAGRADLEHKMGLESKFRLKEAEAKNKFDTGFEILKEQHRIAQEQRAMAQTKLTGGAIAGQVQQQAVGQAEATGQNLPGFTDFSPEVAQATGSHVGAFTAKPIDPLAAPTAAGQLDHVLNRIVTEQGQKRQLHLEQWKYQMDLPTPEDEAKKTGMLEWMQQNAPGSPFILPITMARTRPEIQKAAMEFAKVREKHQGDMARIKSLEDLRFRRDEMVAKHRKEGVQLRANMAAGKMKSAQAIAALRLHAQQKRSHLAEIDRDRNVYMQELAAGPTGARAQAIQGQLRQLEVQRLGVQADIDQFDNALEKHLGTVATNPKVDPKALSRLVISTFNTMFPNKKVPKGKEVSLDTIEEMLSAEEKEQLSKRVEQLKKNLK